MSFHLRIPLPIDWGAVLREAQFAQDMKKTTSSGTYATIGAGAKKTFSVLPGQVKVFASAGNGTRPVVVWVPDTFDPRKPANVVTYFAGKAFDLSADPGPTGLLSRLKKIKSDDNAIYVLPQGWVNDPTDRWMRQDEGESFAVMQHEARVVIGELVGEPITIATRTVVAHSGGGAALNNAIKAGELRADRLLLLDCFYETRGDNWWVTIANWLQGHPDTRTAYYYATNDPARVKEFTSLVTPTITSLTVDRSPAWHGGLPSQHLTPNP